MAVYTDQLGRSVSLPAVPRRIVSLVPSQTELLYDLGLDTAVAGITKFCVHPDAWFRSKTRVGGTKNLHPDIIQQLHPDLILANKEENLREQVISFEHDYPVWISDVNDLATALDMIRSVGDITGTTVKAREIIHNITLAFDSLIPLSTPLPSAYLIWKAPYMSIGRDTFIHDMMQRCGLQNIFSHTTRYPEITVADLHDAGCKLLLLSSEPYPFRDKHIAELQEQLPHTKILLVDGEMFSWYGSRLQQAPAYFTSLLASIR